MPGTLTPAQMFDHELGGLKGWPSPYALDKRVQAFDADEGIVAGMCVYIDPTTGKAKRGAVNGSMPLFVFQGQDEFDVNGDVGNIISGYMNTLVAVGAYELETTEYVAPASYTINETLAVETSDPDDKGKLRAAVGGIAGVEQICGIISEAGPIANSNGKQVIHFWPVFLPHRG